MASSSCASSYSFLKSPLRHFSLPRGTHRTVLLSAVASGRATTPYKNTLIFEATRLLGPPAKFEASKLKVDFRGEEIDNYSRIAPRIYTLSHCDFTANLTLTISNIIDIDQLRGWYNKDDVVAEWKEVKGNMCIHVHCYVSGPNLLFDLAAEFRYHIFSKELPLVLQAVLHGDSALFNEHPELMDSVVWVYFHSSSPKYNRIECWGPLKDAAQKKQEDQRQSLLDTKSNKWSLKTKDLVLKSPGSGNDVWVQQPPNVSMEDLTINTRES